MGFTAGIMFGFVVGLGMVAALTWMMQRRSKYRIAKSADVKLLGGLQQDDIKKLCGGNNPLWISFPAFERVKWLNKQLEKVWPSVAAAASDVIRESVEPVLESYRPIGISSLKFDKLFLGNVAPQIEGVKVQKLKEGQVTMDLDFRWGGDPSIVLGVHTLVGATLPVQLKNLKFFATVRVIFQLSEEIPCISAVVVALLAKPKPEIKYTFKVIGGSLTAVPGLSDMIRDLVETIVVDTLQWPHRIIVPIGGQPVDISDLELKLQGQLTVTVIKAESLKNMEMMGKSDPYVIVYCRVLFKFQTRVIGNNLHPVWNETFTLDVEDQETQSLVLQVMDEDVGDDKLLGLVSFPLSKLIPEQPTKLQLALLPSLDTDRVKDKKDRGTVSVELTFHVYSKPEQDAAMAAEKRFLEEKEKAKEAGLIGNTMDAVGGVVGGAGKLGVKGVGMVGSGIVRGGKMMTRGVSNTIGNTSKKNRDPGHQNGLSR